MRSTLTAALLLGLTGCLPTGSNDFAADAAPACTPGRVEACADPDACVDGAAMAEVCGANGRWLQRRTCEAGAWTELSA